MGRGPAFLEFSWAFRCLIVGWYNNGGGFWRIYYCNLLLTSCSGKANLRVQAGWCGEVRIFYSVGF